MATSQHSAALLENGAAYAWGAGTSGQLGNDAADNQSSPVAVVGGHVFSHIDAGYSHTIGHKNTNGTVWTWGANAWAQLGDNSTDAKSSPVSVVGAHSFTQVCCGAYHGAGLKGESGEVWTWGYNDSGQIGDETRDNRSSPVSVVGMHSFVQICCGRLQTYGLKDDGSAWAWGENLRGFLGNNSTIDVSSPVSVVGAHSFVSIRPSANFLALKEDGTCWTCGYNAYGQIGDDSTDNKSSPVSVVGDHSFIDVVGGIWHTAGLKEDGSVWCWGYNEYGSLGDDTVDAKSSPVLVVGNHSFIQIAAGEHHTLGLKDNGEIWAWGYNNLGQLGNQTTDNKSSPILVVGGFDFYRIMACLLSKEVAWIPRVFIM